MSAYKEQSWAHPLGWPLFRKQRLLAGRAEAGWMLCFVADGNVKKKYVGPHSSRNETELPYSPVIPFLRIYPKELKAGTGAVAHDFKIHNSSLMKEMFFMEKCLLKYN